MSIDQKLNTVSCNSLKAVLIGGFRLLLLMSLPALDWLFETKVSLFHVS